MWSVSVQQGTKIRLQHYLRPGMKLGWTDKKDDEVVAYKIGWVGFECRERFAKSLLAVNCRKESMDTDREALLVWHTIVWQCSFFESSYKLIYRGRAGNYDEFMKTVVHWIKEQDGSVLRCSWMKQVEASSVLHWMNFGITTIFPKVDWEAKPVVRICLEKWKLI